VVNEQITTPAGSIIVNAAHQFALGPTAVGELVIGQSRCSTSATAFTAAPGGAPVGTAAAAAASLARTGSNSGGPTRVGLALVTSGLVALLLSRRRRQRVVDER